MKLKPPPTEQQAFITQQVVNRINTAVMARAGTGKTTLLEMIVDALVEKFGYKISIAVFVFAKKIKVELENKIPAANVKTAHSACYQTLRKHGKYTMNRGNDKSKWLSSQFKDIEHLGYKTDDKAAAAQDRKAVKDMVKFIRLTLTDHLDLDAIFDMCNERHLEMGAHPELNIKFASEALDRHLNNLADGIEQEVDFEDQQWLPIMWDLKFEQSDFVMIDEAQDISTLARECISRCIGPDTTVIAVGDVMQAIFSFAGGDNDSLPLLSKRFNCIEQPLSINWRCGKNIIREAQKLVPDIQYAPNAIDGTVATVSESFFRKQVKEGDMIICRLNAPLAPICVALIKEGKNATIAGQDIGKQIVKIIETVEKLHMGYQELTFNATLKMWLEEEVDRLKERRAPASMMDLLHDKVDVIEHFLSESMRAAAIKDMIKKIFKEAKQGIILSSVHRQKGSEADTVWIIDIKKIRLNRPEMSSVEREQEMHLEYVAKTRAKQAMYYVDKDVEPDHYNDHYGPDYVEPEPIIETQAETKPPSFMDLLKAGKKNQT